MYKRFGCNRKFNGVVIYAFCRGISVYLKGYAAGIFNSQRRKLLISIFTGVNLAQHIAQQVTIRQQAAVNAAKALSDESAKAVAFHDDVLPKMDALRAAADDAETICGEDYWPLPSYSKMLYYV